MDGYVVAVVVLGVFALVAWRWWLADRTAARTHEAALHGKAVDAATAAQLAVQGKLAALEDRVRALEYRKA